jgi:O-methyltransferase
MKKAILKLIEKAGYTVYKTEKQKNSTYGDITEPEFWELYEFCKPYTKTSIERMYSLYSSVNYVLDNQIEGDIVECGVWRGGSAMMIAKMLHKRGITNRKVYLYDTFEGMSAPTKEDVDVDGSFAGKLMEDQKDDKINSVWCLADLNDVSTNMKLTQFKEENIVYVEGKVEDTIPGTIPSKIALLRLDTDWYFSTKHELIHLYPLLVKNGILIIDDYGHWQGCKKAVNEYFEEHKIKMLLNRVDYTGRIGHKI